MVNSVYGGAIVGNGIPPKHTYRNLSIEVLQEGEPGDPYRYMLFSSYHLLTPTLSCLKLERIENISVNRMTNVPTFFLL